MPEGHSILRAAQQWNKIAGVPLRITSPQGRFSADAVRIDGLPLKEAKAHGKHLFLYFDDNLIVHIHLGLYGKMWQRPADAPAPVGAVRLRASGSLGTIDLNGPTACKLMDQAEVDTILSRLGPDPLKLENPPKAFLEQMALSKAPVGKILMEQDKLAGVGNFYRAEVLFFDAISPYRLASKLTEKEWVHLWRTTRELMLLGVGLPSYTKSIAPGWIRAKTVGAKKLPAESYAYLYKRTGLPCFGCGKPVEAESFHGRMLYVCRTCQV